ncbi:dihydrofolate reductase family protein [Nitrosovibrio tenuis]|uniref:Dihydrofolate reductase n=1 Tax=Nitrosovibrio tenuis TaxID=1233 RepID=A0A1H7NQF6_9PROT|nr:dihydrofolate reductase family protein [Nitrosovibrio tenuis]SEL25275.1 Dihydrofolate reductase [Nitrosovibrio tenuis]
MRKLTASTFISLDGIMQAPGGPTEDPSGGFSLGGWIFHYWDEVMRHSMPMSGFDGKDRELVLGRKTYEIFEAYWPYQPADDPTAQTLNTARKHVASRTLKALHWQNSGLLNGDVGTAVATLKSQDGPDLQIIGSGALIQALQTAGLIDEYHVWTFPVLLGAGKRLFETGAKPGALRLTQCHHSTTGVVMSTYVMAGEIPLGSFAQDAPSDKERERREKWAREEQ